MKNAKNRRLNNLINGLLASALLFGCSCTLCNKRYYVNFISPPLEAAATGENPVIQNQTAGLQKRPEK